MQTPGQEFYSQKAARTFTRQDVLDGKIVKINPALITITDGFVDRAAPAELQQRVVEQVHQVLAGKVQTLHVDINFEDYSGFGAVRPDLNQVIFTPPFLQNLNEFVQAQGVYLNLHLLTDFPLQHLAEYAAVGAGAICFQLDTVPDRKMLAELIDHIRGLGACASPVIETVGTENLKPRGPEAVLEFLEPMLSQVGMLTLQVAETAARSNKITGRFAMEQARDYISFIGQGFGGTIQLQGGMTTQTIGKAAQLGAGFIVCGSEIFRNRAGRSPAAVVDQLLQQAAEALV